MKRRQHLNQYFPGGPVRMWLRFDPSEDDDYPIEEVTGLPVLGARPDELDAMCGWNGILDVESYDRMKALDWMLQRGLVPGQRFQVELDPPRYYRCGEFNSEWDVEYDWEILTVEPLPATVAADILERDLEIPIVGLSK